MIEYIGDIPVAAEEPQEPQERDFIATIGSYSSSGITLKFDGAAAATTKKYKFNKGISSSYWGAGKRVKCVRISGTILVEYPIT
ncbi:MAG: hypothetical protein MJ014_00325 [Methanocorpusculum sp.]|nr:hypothetical protein [Methanocorpusculum sp.]